MFISPFKDPTALPGYVEHRLPATKKATCQAAMTKGFQINNAHDQLLNGLLYMEILRTIYLEGTKPEFIISHSGWGCGLMAKEIFQTAKLIIYNEWYFNQRPEFINFLKTSEHMNGTDEFISQLLMRNIPTSYELQVADYIVCPTKWQLLQMPAKFRACCHIVSDGLRPYLCNYMVKNRFNKPPFQKLIPSLKKYKHAITYFARGFEPIRLFPLASEILGRYLNLNRDSCAILVGSDKVFYGSNKTKTYSFLSAALEGPLLDSHNRGQVKVISTLPYKHFVSLLHSSSCHLYLTSPFVLSWSFLDALALNLPIISNNSPPVLEFLGKSNAFIHDSINNNSFVNSLVDAVSNNVVIFDENQHNKYLLSHSWHATHSQLKNLLLT